MAITSYSTLKTEIANWVDRDDLTDHLDTFIDLTEADINRRLRIQPMETVFSGSIASGVFALPSGYRETLVMYHADAAGGEIETKPLDWLIRQYPTRSSSGRPCFAARAGSNFEFGPYPDSTYALSGIYYKAFDALSSSNETNWLTTDAPDLLLYGCLVQAEAFGWNDARLPMIKGAYEQALDHIATEDTRQRTGRAPRMTAQ
jgi:hypothetical protein